MASSSAGVARPGLAIACLSASLFLQEVLLTRLFSVTLYHHFAFVAISVGMLGLAAGGIRLTVAAKKYKPENAAADTRRAAVSFAAASLVAVGILVQVGLSPFHFNWVRAFVLAGIYLVAFVPFYFGGIAFALIFTHSKKQFARLYAIDLMAAGACGFLVGPMLSAFGAPAALLVAALVAALGGVIAFTSNSPRERWISWGVIAVICLAIVGDRTMGLFRIRWAKEKAQEKIAYEAWNSLSRVAVYDLPFGPWALGTKYKGPPPEGVMMDIDASAATPILHGMSGPGVEHLRDELTSLAYYVAPPKGHSLVIGAGGGRDILCALLAGMDHVDGVEINPIIANDVMRGRYAEFSGRLYLDPRVDIHVGDGRSFVAGTDAKFDSIQASLVDTWAATAAGAFALSENNLYTQEAMRQYIDHLSPDGVLTLIRWDGPEVYRVIIMLSEAARSLGIEDPKSHLAILTAPNTPIPTNKVTNILFRRSAFDDAAIAKLDTKAETAGFDWAFHPRRTIPGRVSEIASAASPLAEAQRTEAYELRPSTDDWPFFFYRPRPSFFAAAMEDPRRLYFEGPYLLAEILLVATVLAFVCLLLPLMRLRREAAAKGATPPKNPRAAVLAGSYFVCLGVGFMFLEVSMMQRFVLFLGHPTYALTAVMAGLLVGAGVGSGLVPRFAAGDASERRPFSSYLGIVAAIAIGGSAVLHPAVFGAAQHLSFATRLVITQVLVLPLGVVLGTLMPLGIARLTANADELVPWAWGLNGFASVVGSCLAVLLSMSFGFSFTFTMAALCYVAAACVALLEFRAARVAGPVVVTPKEVEA